MAGQHSRIHIDNSTSAEVIGLTDHNDVYQNDASVTLEDLVDRITGVQVTGGNFPYSLAYQVGSNGDYKVILPPTLAVVENRTYIATFKAVSSQTYQGTWKELVRARRRIN